jgi:hypothetical protein
MTQKYEKSKELFNMLLKRATIVHLMQHRIKKSLLNLWAGYKTTIICQGPIRIF